MPRIFLTGNVGIEAGDSAFHHAEAAGRQARVVFAYLVLERRRAVPREELAEALWLEALPQSWEAALRVVVSKVRAVFASVDLASAGVLTNAFGCYQLHLPPDTTVDVDVATSAIAAAEAALAGGELDAAISKALEAQRITGRPFLPGESSIWAERTRSRLHEVLLRALEVLSQARAAQGDSARALEAAEEAVRIDPFRESAHRCLMSAHVDSGNRAAALKAYESCRRLLASELGVGPSAETEATYLKLLRTDEPKSSDDKLGLTARQHLPVPFPDALRVFAPALLVGRDPEMKRVRSAWDLAIDHRRQVVLLAGEAGMGKTALSAQVAEKLHAEGAAIFYGRCDKDILVPYQPFVEAVGRYVRTCPPERLRDEVGPEGTDLARLVVDLPRWLPELSLPSPAEPETERHRLFGAVAAFFNGVAGTSSVVLVIDDLQWVGQAALVLLRHLIRALETSRVLFLVSYRDDEINREDSLAEVLTDLDREPGIHRLHLSGLDEKAVNDLLGSFPGAEAFDVTTAGTVQEQTQGNPLFVTELLRQLAEPMETSSSDEEAPGGRHFAVGGSRTMHEVLRQRCARLSTTARQALELAAVIGENFRLDVIQEVTGLKEESVIGALEESLATRLVHDVPEAAGTYCFANVFLRDVLYGALSGARRSYLHRRVGLALEASDSGRRPTMSAELARHFVAAGEIEKAFRYTVAAGDHAIQCLAYEGAAQHYEQALQLGLDTSDDRSRRCSVLMALAMAHRKSGQVAAARDAYLEATSLARHLGDPHALAACALGVGGGGRGVSAWIADEVRVSLLEEALGALGAEDSDLRVSILAELARALYFSPEEQRRERLAQEAVDVARRLGQPTALAGALSATRVIRWGPANTELRIAYGGEVVALSEQSMDAELIVRARLARIPDLIEVGDLDAAHAELDASAEIAVDLRQPYYLWRTVSWNALMAIIEGRWNEASERADHALEIWQGHLHPDARDCDRIQRATIAAGRGRLRDAVGRVRSVAEARPMIPAYRGLLANFLVKAGCLAEARAEFERFATDGFLSPPIDAHWLMGASALAETCALLNDRIRAEVLYELLMPYQDRLVVLDSFGGGGSFQGPVSYHLGLLAGVMGLPHQAESHLDTAHALCVRVGATHYISVVQDAMSRHAAGESNAGLVTMSSDGGLGTRG